MADYDNSLMKSIFKLKRLSGRKPLPTEHRFHEQYIPEPTSGCWLWIGTERGSNKYGSIKHNGRNIPAHRYSWTLFKGEIPKGMLVLHHCDNPACVNPNHLFIGTNQDNSDDKLRKGRQAKGQYLSEALRKGARRGEMRHDCKISDEQRRSIPTMPGSNAEIARKLGVSKTLIWRIKNARV